MADWDEPTTASPYEDIPGHLKELSIDAATLFANEPTHPIDAMIKLVRSPTRFQERETGSWSELALSIDGGGTGAANAADARTNLGLGTMATQDSDDVTITGGSIAGTGSGLTGLNATNLSSGTVPQARRWTEGSTTSSGNQDDFDFSSVDLLRCNNSSPLTIRGLLAGVAGQRLTIVSVGTGQVDIANQNSNSSAANRVINGVTATISLAAGVGRLTVEYDGTAARWRVIEHSQGAWISPAFNAGDYSANGSMTWTVDSADVLVCTYWLKERTLFVNLMVDNGSIGGTANKVLQRVIPGGFTAATIGNMPCRIQNAGVYASGGIVEITASGTLIGIWRDGSGNTNWSLGANSAGARLAIAFEVQ